MEEWSLKLKLLHWMMIERADGVSPFICFDDDGGDGGGDGGDGGDDGGDDDDGAEGGEDGFEGDGFEGDGFEGGEGEGEGGEGEGGEGFEGGTDGPESDADADAEADFEFSDNAGGYADYGGAPDAPSTPDPTTPDVPDPNVPDPNVPDKPDPVTIELMAMSKEKSDKEEKEDKEDKEVKGIELPVIDVYESGQPDPSGPGAGSSAGISVEGTGSSSTGGASTGGAAATGGGSASGGSAGGGAAAGGTGIETAGLDSGAGGQGGGVQDSQGGGGSGGVQDLFDVPMRAPSAKEREKELEREFQQQLAPQPPQQPLPPPPSFTPPTFASVRDAIANALVGSAQAAPAAPSTAQSPGVPQEFYGKEGPLTDPNKEPGRPSFDYLPGIDAPPSREKSGKEKEKEEDKDPFSTQQTALNTLGIGAPTVSNPNARGSLGAPGVPGFDYGVQGALASQLAGQQSPTAVNQAAKSDQVFDLPPSANPVPTVSFTPPGPVGTAAQVAREGKADRENRSGRDFNAKPDVFDPNTFAPPVGMLMSQVPPGQITAPWPGATQPDQFGTPGPLSGPTGQQPSFDRGPAPPAPSPQVAQAPPYDPNVFNPGQMRATPGIFQQGPLAPPGPVRVPQAPPPTKEIVSTPPGRIEEGPFSPMRDIAAQPTPTPAPPTAPGPSAPHGGVNVAIQDASGNTAVQAPGFAPEREPGPIEVALGAPPSGTIASQPDIFGGGPPPVLLPQQQQQLQLQRQRRREIQARRDAVAEAMMRIGRTGSDLI